MSTVAPTSVADRLRAVARAPAATVELAMLGWLVPLALVHGLIYLVIVPPWQHYDEPTHFLYAAEIAAGEVSAPGPASDQLRRQIADSMYRFRFYPPGGGPDLSSPAPPEIGLDQRVHPPLYYTLAALPLRLLGDRPAETQLFAARLVSLALYALTVVAAWRIAVALAPDEPLMQWVVPLLVLLSPAFTDIMTAVNNDALLNFSLTVTILGAVLLVRDGLRPLPLALIGVSMAVAFFTKRTALVMLAPLAFAFVWALLRRPLRWWVLPLLGIIALGLGGAATLQPVVVEGPTGPHTILTMRPWFVAFDEHYLRIRADELVRSITDLERARDYHQALVIVGFGGYYTHFGWGQPTLHQAWTWVLAGLSLVATVGLVVVGLHARATLPLWRRRGLWLFLIMVCTAWASLFLRLHPIPPDPIPVYIPRARYMFWTMVPTLWLLALGLTWATPARWRHITPVALLGFFACMDMAAWMWTLPGHFYR